MVVPLNKERAYKEIRLENDIKVLMIHDPTIQFVELSLSWQNGNWNDDKGKVGISNLIQHMVAQGMPYNNYQSLYDCVDQLDGISDSYIDDIFTDFYIKLDTLDKMKTALDMLSELLISPDFMNNKVEEEINEIRDEEQLKLQGDRWAQ